MTATTSDTLLRVLAARGDSTASPRGIQIASVLFITALTATAAQISVPLPFTTVPLTLQPMIVLVGSLALGSRLGAAIAPGVRCPGREEVAQVDRDSVGREKRGFGRNDARACHFSRFDPATEFACILQNRAGVDDGRETVQGEHGS